MADGIDRKDVLLRAAKSRLVTLTAILNLIKCIAAGGWDLLLMMQISPRFSFDFVNFSTKNIYWRKKMLYSEVNFHTSFIVCIHLLHLDSKRNKSKLNLNCFLTVSCKAIEISNHLFNLTVTRYKCIIVLNLYCCEKLKISCIQPCENLDIILAIFFVCLRCCAGGQKVKVPRI
jgi:hypothetical protein